VRPLRNWNTEDIQNLVDCCVILHNMVMESRRNARLGPQELEPAGESTVNVSLFGGTVQERLAATNDMTQL
jgi:hypothetical protein